MKKLLSIIILIIMVFMLEFNLLEPIFNNAYRWIEAILAFAAIIAVGIWNGLHIKKNS